MPNVSSTRRRVGGKWIAFKIGGKDVFVKIKGRGRPVMLCFQKRGTSSEKVRFKFLFLIPVSSSIIRDSI